MVESSQNSSGSQNPELTKLCNGSDAAEASLKSKMSDLSIQFPVVNGNSAETAKMNGDGCNKHEGQKELANGNSNEVLHSNVPIVNGNSHSLIMESIPTVNGNSAENVLANNLSTKNKNSVQDEAPLCNEGDKNSDNFSNGSSTLSESESSNNSDSLHPKDQGGFIQVLNKRHKKSQKKRYQKPTSNLPPVQKDTKCDNKSDKLSEKSSSSQKPPPKNFSTVKTPGVSYSMVVSKGATGNSCGLKNGASSDSEGIAKDKISMKSQQSDLLKKVEKHDVSAQTDVCSETGLCPSTKISSVQSISPIESTDFSCVPEPKDESSNASVVSNDSGRGDSEISFDHQNPYFCTFPLDKVRILIGRHGSYRTEIEKRTGATFWVHTEFMLAPNTTLVEFTGPESAVDNAREMIKRRFRNVTLERLINPFFQGPYTMPTLSESIRAHLPLGIEIMSVVSCIYSPSYFFIQQFGHPEYHPLEDLEKAMSAYFNSSTDAPGITELLPEHVVAVPVILEEETKWVRGVVIRELDDGKVLARYLDHGGEVAVPVTELREMRSEFFTISFFASKCCLFGVLPAENQWSMEACQEFQRLCNGAQPPLVKVVYQVPEGYFVTLYGYDNEAHCRVNVAEVLVNKGLARIGDTFVPNE